MSSTAKLVNDILDGTNTQHDAAVEAIKGLVDHIREQEDELDYLRERAAEDDRIIQTLLERIEYLQASVAELQRAGKQLLDDTTEAPWERHARVPRFYIRELEKALQETATESRKGGCPEE